MSDKEKGNGARKLVRFNPEDPGQLAQILHGKAQGLANLAREEQKAGAYGDVIRELAECQALCMYALAHVMASKARMVQPPTPGLVIPGGVR